MAAWAGWLPFLAVNLKGIGNANGKNTPIKDGQGPTPYAGEGNRSQRQMPRSMLITGAEHALDKRETHRIDSLGKPPDNNDMEGKEYGSQKLEDITETDGHLFGHAQEDKAPPQPSTAPIQVPVPARCFHKSPRTGTMNHIKACDESGFSSRCIDKSNLLQG